MISLSGKVALVTGASRGIGRTIATRLASRGARVVATGRDEDALRGLAEEVGIDYVTGSIVEPDDCERIVAETTERLGPIEILVNNAGVVPAEVPVWEVDPKDWSSTFAVNLDGAFELTRLVAGGMVERRHGRIVMICSTAGNVGMAGRAAYCASKHGMLGLMRAVAQDVGAHGVTCNAVCPGGVYTPLTERWLDAVEARGGSREQALADAAAQYLPGRLVEPEEVAAAVAFLASEEASGINGEVLTVALGSDR